MTNVVYLNDKCLIMKKSKKIENKVEEPLVSFQKSIRVIPTTKEYTYSDFKKMADTIPFTQAEWATFLHISERTLQRYAKANSSFASINAERALQINKVIKEGKNTFGSVEKFYEWLKSSPQMLEGKLTIQSLTSYDGIESVLKQLGRIQHGILA